MTVRLGVGTRGRVGPPRLGAQPEGCYLAFLLRGWLVWRVRTGRVRENVDVGCKARSVVVRLCTCALCALSMTQTECKSNTSSNFAIFYI